MKDLRRNVGLTLIEVVVATAILAVLTVTALLTLVPISRQNRLSRESELAASAARDVLEQIQATPFHEIPTRFPPGSELPIPGLEEGSITVLAVGSSVDPLVLQLDLGWESADGGDYGHTFYAVRTE